MAEYALLLSDCAAGYPVAAAAAGGGGHYPSPYGGAGSPCRRNDVNKGICYSLLPPQQGL